MRMTRPVTAPSTNRLRLGRGESETGRGDSQRLRQSLDGVAGRIGVSAGFETRDRGLVDAGKFSEAILREPFTLARLPDGQLLHTTKIIGV